MRNDHLIYELRQGRMVRVGEPQGDPTHYNFVIVCHYGDWSGFRTLAACEAQFAELESKGQRDGYYRVVERR